MQLHFRLRGNLRLVTWSPAGVFKNGSRRHKQADLGAKHFPLVSSAATALATVDELTGNNTKNVATAPELYYRCGHSHQAFFTHEALTEIARVATDNILRWESGQPLLPGRIL